MQSYDVIVIGGGQAGLAMGYHLQKAGHRFLILEAGEHAVGSWANYYESLSLFSPAQYSSLPEYHFKGDPNRYPTRDEVIDYLADYARHFKLPIQTLTRVEKIEKQANRFIIQSSKGTFEALAIVAASGSFSRPNLPDYPNQADFEGTIIHSSQYKNPDAFRDKRVIVVGAGNSAIQIGVELGQYSKTSIANQSPIQFRQQVTYGKDLHFWLKWTGIDYFPYMLWTKFIQKTLLKVGVLDTGKYQAAIRAGQPDERRIFKAFTKTGVIWEDGSEEAVDAVIYATGFSPNLPYLAGLGALDEAGNPLHLLGASTTIDGLYYLGLSNQVSIGSATLRGVGRDGRIIISRINRYLAGKTCCRQATLLNWWRGIRQSLA
jgi:putative flavoprotein involved in K+ transport